MASAWDISSSAVILAIFLGVVYAAIRLQSVLTQKTSSTQTNLAQKGVTYNQGRLSVVTDRAAPSREEYIASTQRAFEKGAKTMALHPDAFKTGPKNAEGNVEVLSSSGVDSPGKSGFRRTKKLA